MKVAETIYLYGRHLKSAGTTYRREHCVGASVIKNQRGYGPDARLPQEGRNTPRQRSQLAEPKCRCERCGGDAGISERDRRWAVGTRLASEASEPFPAKQGRTSRNPRRRNRRAEVLRFRLARENEQLCIVMFLAILLFRIFCYIIVRLKKQRILLLRKRMTKMVHKRWKTY